MSEHAMDRRDVLRGATVLAGGAAAAGVGLAQPASADDTEAARRHSIVGNWMVRRTNADGSVTRTVASFAAGGVHLTNDISPTGPLYTGTWRQEGDATRAVLWAGFPGETPGSPGPTVQVKVRGRVRDDRIDGTFTFTLFAPDGDTVLQRGSGSYRGFRIEG